MWDDLDYELIMLFETVMRRQRGEIADDGEYVESTPADEVTARVEAEAAANRRQHLSIVQTMRDAGYDV